MKEISDILKDIQKSTFDLNFNLREPCTSLLMTLLYPVLILTMPFEKKYDMNVLYNIEVAWQAKPDLAPEKMKISKYFF